MAPQRTPAAPDSHARIRGCGSDGMMAWHGDGRHRMRANAGDVSAAHPACSDARGGAAGKGHACARMRCPGGGGRVTTSVRPSHQAKGHLARLATQSMHLRTQSGQEAPSVRAGGRARRVRSRCGDGMSNSPPPRAGDGLPPVCDAIGAVEWIWHPCETEPAIRATGQCLRVRGRVGRANDFTPAPRAPHLPVRDA